MSEMRRREFQQPVSASWSLPRRFSAIDCAPANGYRNSPLSSLCNTPVVPHVNINAGLISMMRTCASEPESMIRNASPSSPSTFWRTMSTGKLSTLANGSQS